MQAASIVFPFRPTFRRLKLEKRWWHRLSVVIFFVALLGVTAFTAVVSYSVFTPQIQTMPDIHVCDIFDQVTAEQQHQNVPNGGCLDISSGLVPKQQSTDPWAVVAVDGKPVQPMIDPQGTVQQVPINQVNAALMAGSKRVVAIFAPDGIKRWIPEDEVQIAIQHGGKFADSVTLDFSKAQPSLKSIQMPDGSTSTFAGTVSDDSIKAQWSHAKTVQTWKAVGWTGLLTVAIALFVNYLLQGSYRALLYVIFGRVAHPFLPCQ
jgi:hypothetical protein